MEAYPRCRCASTGCGGSALSPSAAAGSRAKAERQHGQKRSAMPPKRLLRERRGHPQGDEALQRAPRPGKRALEFVVFQVHCREGRQRRELHREGPDEAGIAERQRHHSLIGPAGDTRPLTDRLACAPVAEHTGGLPRSERHQRVVLCGDLCTSCHRCDLLGQAKGSEPCLVPCQVSKLSRQSPVSSTNGYGNTNIILPTTASLKVQYERSTSTAHAILRGNPHNTDIL
mmetsp:Transcript_28681/g.68415  ORF Transcript_28681/g.68415 Transcript_28681/m.68415 type:complete len:229 (-) Transcript_28681:834-1520(-)